MTSGARRGSADVVVVGGGTVGGWTAALLAEQGAGHVVLLDAGRLGEGASSRAAGMVRAQGGTVTAVRLGRFSQDFYRTSGERFPLDCGFRAQGYLMPCFTDDDVAAAHDRMIVQRSEGLEVEWLDGSSLHPATTGLAAGVAIGASYAAGDGYIDAPRNVQAYVAATAVLDVDVREGTAFTGLLTSGGHVVGVETSHGVIATGRVVLTGGPQLAAVGAAAGGRVPAGGVRHQVVVTEPVPGVDVGALPMVFDIGSGLYWRPGDDGGLLWGMSNPDEAPGPAISFDEAYYERMRGRLDQLFPAVAGLRRRRSWAATIDYTPDHLPILGPLLTDDGPVDGTVVASAAGHGMMWGPGVARAAADLVVSGTCTWLDVTDLGLDRFDANGVSRVATEPVSLPFPVSAVLT